MAGNNSGTTSWGVAITLIAFLIIVDSAVVAYSSQGSSVISLNSTEYNSSSTATYNSTGVKFINDIGHTPISHDIPGWMQTIIFVMNALVLVLVFMLLRGVW